MKKRLILSLVLLFSIFLAGLLIYNYKVSTPVSREAQDVVFVIESGAGAKKIGADLAQANLIKSEFFFKFYLWKNNLSAELKAGEYVLSPSLSMKEIVKVLSTGDSSSKERTIKLIEGWNTKDIATYFETEEMFKADDFLALSGYPKIDYRQNTKYPDLTDYSVDYDFLKDKPSYRGLEGYLFPDTYRIFVDATADEVIRKMLNNFGAKLTPDLRAEIEKQDKTIYEIVTMASIIQKEVRNEKDMKIVSGIFWNRIKNGQALESCATLAYVLGENKKQYTYEDTRIESPYNCYLNRGLPPGPIANPGIEAIKAAIYPEDTNYNYFLSSFETGETIYSRTFEEHVRNKEKYLR